MNDKGLHFYHELAPVRTAVVSPLGPMAFTDLLMGRRDGFQGLPAIAFAELELEGLASDPINGSASSLPYENLPHLRRCLDEVSVKHISSKLFDLSGTGILSFRVVKNGVFVRRHVSVHYAFTGRTQRNKQGLVAFSQHLIQITGGGI